MRLPPGTYELGPDNATLSVRTGRTGAVAKAGHDLLLDVTAWRATLEVGEDSAPTGLTLEADATSLRVREGTGGLQALDDDDRSSIEQTIDEEVLLRRGIEFRSTSLRAEGDRIAVDGELTLAGATRPIAFEIAVDGDGTLSGSTVLAQSQWGITPYSTLFGALKVADDVRVEFVARMLESGSAVPFQVRA
ncbi:MAG: YceI family protein [Thermoleophilia bacterium]|nr:YceI family protein [Thermoleophilia bacterium]